MWRYTAVLYSKHSVELFSGWRDVLLSHMVDAFGWFSHDGCFCLLPNYYLKRVFFFFYPSDPYNLIILGVK